ncbi:MAG: nitronate monooxygenase [Candidatus Niyogibacteria bacterium]|nr:nitronate monooxygenase [Candidatus Niyogibacteria bacterium]
MIRFSNGQTAMFFAASGSMGFDGRGWLWERWMPKRWLDPSLFWVATKTLALSRRKGNSRFRWLSWLNVRPLFRNGTLVGWVNALGMPGPGFGPWLLEEGRSFAQMNGVVSLASVEGDIQTRAINLALMMLAVCGAMKNLAALEVNVSCPNTENGKLPTAEEVVYLLREIKESASRSSLKKSHPIIVKLSVAQDYCEIARRLEKDRLAEAISINSVPWKRVFPARTSPFAKFGGGGVSGKIAQEHTWEMVQKLSEASSIPVIAPSIWNYEDIDHAMQLGAQAVSFGSVFMATPWWPTQAVRRWNEEQRMLKKAN